MYHKMITGFMSDLTENERYCGEFILEYGFYSIILVIKDTMEVELIRVEKMEWLSTPKNTGDQSPGSTRKTFSLSSNFWLFNIELCWKKKKTNITNGMIKTHIMTIKI